VPVVVGRSCQSVVGWSNGSYLALSWLRARELNPRLRSAGFVPLRILATYVAACRVMATKFGQ